MDTAPHPELAHQATAIARQTMSPFCPGRTLYDCPSPNAADWRRDIESMLAAGKSSPEIQAVLAERAALDLTGSPNSGASYLWPVLALLFAVLALTLVLRRLRSRAPVRTGQGEVVTGNTPVGDARLDSELEDVR